MKANETGRTFFLLLIAGLLLNSLLCIGFYFREAGLRDKRLFEHADKALEKLHSGFSVEIALKDQVRQILQKLMGLGPDEAVKELKRWQKANFLHADAVELVMFRNDQPVNCSEAEREDWALMYKIVSRDYLRKFRLEGEGKSRIVKLLRGGVGFETIESKPGILHRMNRGPQRTYAAWQKSDKKTGSDRIDAAILLIHEGKLAPDFLARFLIREFPSNAGQVAYVDMFRPDNSIIPQSRFGSLDVIALVNTFHIKNYKKRCILGGKEVLLSVKPDGNIFIFIPFSAPASIPFWTVALPFFWIPFLWRYISTSEMPEILTLKNLLITVSLVGIILPAILTGYYWKSFLETKRASIKIEFARKLEEFLIQLDARHQLVLRRNKSRFRNFMKILDRKPENLQKFIDESLRLELDMVADTLILVDSTGKFYRSFSSTLSRVRGLIFFPKKFRENVVKQFLELGWVPFDLEVNYIMNYDGKNFDFKQHFDFSRNQGQRVITSLGKIAGTDIVQSYNSRHGFARPDDKTALSAVVMGSFVEDAEENPAAVIGQNLGDYVEFGFGEYQSRNYVDVIRDRDGKALYCAILYCASLLSYHQYFDELFTHSEKWPEHVKYLAISGLPLRLSYPWPDAWKRMESLLSLLKPPRNLLVDEVKINGEPHLRCSFVAKNCEDYILVALLPLKAVETEVTKLRNSLIIGFLLLLISLVFVFAKLFNGIVRPAGQLMKGVSALNKKDHSYQIKLKTGDEWEQLGNTFNQALEGIKELEVAHFVQTCILPGNEIATQNTTFLGKTSSAEEIGGDYYDAFAKDEGLVFIMGDVSGHSISAALVVNMAKAAFCALIDSGLLQPHQIFTSMNRLLLEHLKRVKMMTCFAGLINGDGELNYCNAGQAFPFILSDSRVEVLRQVGYPLGAAKKKFEPASFQLPQYCRIVIFSDGVIEALNEDSQPFGYERLENLVKKLGHRLPREEFISAVFEELAAFTGDIPWADDVTLVVIDHDRRAIVI